jgi:hypothetical protein
MYQGAGDPRTAQRSLDSPAGFSPEATARLILGRIRTLLEAYTHGMRMERRRWREDFANRLSDPVLERERLFALGWLHWLNDEPAAAEPLLAEAMHRAREQTAMEALAESAYWYSRVRLLRGEAEALPEFEMVLRTLGGSPRATVWFVDLLWRAGRIERAEQVWKSVRGNRRVAGCAEGPLLEARSLLRRGETTPAERLLNEATPNSGVAEVERLLLLAWVAASLQQHDKARSFLHQAREGTYPEAALRIWTERTERRLRGERPAEEGVGSVPPALREYLRGQQARSQGRTEEAIAAYRAALDTPAQPFARYALACLVQEDWAAVLASQPGWFLAVRCRARLTLERFRRREASPVECLDALRQAAAAGYQDVAAEHFGRLATVLQQHPLEVACLRELAACPIADAAARNAFRAALEVAARRLPRDAARELLLEWSQRADLDEELRSLVARQLLRLLLFGDSDEEMRSALGRLLPDEPLLALVYHPAAPAQVAPLPAPRDGPPSVRLWQAARTLDQQSTESERWREEVRNLRSHSRLKGLAQALLLQEAAQRGDVAAVLGLLDEVEFWCCLRVPPRFVLRCLENLLAARRGHPGWRRVLARWLSLWDEAALVAAGKTLAAHAGLSPLSGETAEPPSGVPAVPWFLHQAARALTREDPVEALAFTRRALALDPDLATVPQAHLVREALPEIVRRARAQTLSSALRPDSETVLPVPILLVDAVDALMALPEGMVVLDELARGERADARARIEELCDRPGLPPRLAHHLALLMLRAARALEAREQTENAETYWRRSWRCWLRFFAAAPEPDARRVVLDWLLGLHRRCLNELLARGAIDAARMHWNLVPELPGWAVGLDEPLGRDLSERVERFREELATEYLLTTREAMRYGAIPDGWRFDYEKGLGYLRRLLSLDRDNVRLLTALVEICNDWFFDLYRLGEPGELRAQLERFTPFALQLARRIEERPGELYARAALSDFWKVRGFLAADREHKTDLYREALRLNPANHNVRDLLAELEASRLGPEDDTADV